MGGGTVLNEKNVRSVTTNYILWSFEQTSYKINFGIIEMLNVDWVLDVLNNFI